MSIQAQRIKLNVVPGGIIPVLNVSQNDIGRTLQFELYDGVSAASIAAGTTATIEGTKPDNHAFQYSATVSGNTVTVDTTQQMVIVPGKVECTLTLTYSGQIIGTALFFMEVERSGLDMNADISDTELPILVDLGRHYAELSEQYKNEALNSKIAAASSETAAKISEINAAISENAARRSELNAATSENAAHGYADSAEADSIQAQTASSVAVSAASDANTNNEEAKALLLEAKQMLIDTVFTVDMETGELLYTSTDSYTFSINTTTGNLEWEVAA